MLASYFQYKIDFTTNSCVPITSMVFTNNIGSNPFAYYTFIMMKVSQLPDEVLFPTLQYKMQRFTFLWLVYLFPLV